MKNRVAQLAVFLFLINSLLIINAQTEPEVHSITGIVTTFTDSGLGPHYAFDVENPETKESITTLLYLDYVFYLNDQFGSEEEVLGKQVEVKYTYDNEYLAENTSKGSEVVLTPENENMLTVVGTFLDCQVGDMGGYLDIKLPNGEQMDFMTLFYCPENIKEGDPIVVYYTINEIVEVTEVKAIK